MSAATVQKQGLPVTTNVPAGTTLVEYQVIQTSPTATAAAASVQARTAAARGRVLAKLYRFPKRAGLFKVRLKSKALQRKLKPGRYALVVRMGKSKTKLGRPRTLRFQLRR
jgi:hypothetical protein